jgi:site-specific DNA-methyltransferase (adenine-specific)
MAPRNRTLKLSAREKEALSKRLIVLKDKTPPVPLENVIINQDMVQACLNLPKAFADLLIFDPPYNLSKSFNGKKFRKQGIENYAADLDRWIQAALPCLKPTASIYICGDWLTSTSIHLVASKYFKIRNRITWEREKGRGALSNWKNCSEDIWFCTFSDRYTFNAAAVKLKRRVIAPYRDENKKPKDWEDTAAGKYRLTHPSNLWSDITVPFWSMPENTTHPTQKPEKLIAKLILASTKKNDFIFDPFLGSGTTAVTAKKLERRFIGIEQDLTYCCLAQKRLLQAEENASIQGYSQGVFWERNSGTDQKKPKAKIRKIKESPLLDFLEG